jgi:hypothetical protein
MPSNFASVDGVTSEQQGRTPDISVGAQVQDRIARAREQIQRGAPETNQAFEYWRGHQYWYINPRGALEQMVSGRAGTRAPGKPSHRVREPHNMIYDFVAHEVSAATSRTPGYEVVPTTGDPQDQSAAKVAQDVAVYGHDKWNIEDVTIKAVTHAVISGEAFAWPYFDTSIGPFIKGTEVGVGDICIEVYGKNQVGWEPGARFEKSAYHIIEVAMTPEAVKELPGYKGPSDPPTDADAMSEVQRGYRSADRRMTLVTHYLERPSPKKPEGCWKILVGGIEVCPEQPYPGDGQRPCLVKLSYSVDPDNDRDMGLVPQLIPAQNQFNDSTNKIEEWTKLHLMGGRICVTPGLMGNQKLTDEPGKAYQVPQPNENIKIWEPPPIPPQLFEIRDSALAEMARIAAQNDIPAQVESGKGVVALTERDASRRGTFLKQLARFFSHLMSACLVLVQKYYTEDRVIAINGDFGWESHTDFQGAQLSDNLDVRVNPSSLEYLTRAGVEARVIAYADRMWIPPEVAMRAINTGNADELLGNIERAEARVNRVIRRIKEGTVFDMATRTVPAPPDPITGQRIDPLTGMPSMEVPGWMPLPWDNLEMWKTIFENFFSTEYMETAEEAVQEAGNLIYQQVLVLQEQEAMMQQMRAQQTAAQLGLGNAASPQGPPSMPDMPQLGQPNQGGQPEGGLKTPNQPASQSGP